jgi:hypothetical protein
MCNANNFLNRLLFVSVATVHPVMDNRLVKRKSADEEEMEKVEEEMTEEEEEMLPDIVYTDETSNEEEMLAVSPDSEILQVEDDCLGLEEEEGKTMENRPEPEAEVMVEHVQQKRVIKEKMPQQSVSLFRLYGVFYTHVLRPALDLPYETR